MVFKIPTTKIIIFITILKKIIFIVYSEKLVMSQVTFVSLKVFCVLFIVEIVLEYYPTISSLLYTDCRAESYKQQKLVKIWISLKVCHIQKKDKSTLLVSRPSDGHFLTGIGNYRLIYEFWQKNLHRYCQEQTFQMLIEK